MKKLSLVNKILYFFNLLFTVAWALAFLAPYLNPKTFSLSAVLAIAYPIIIGIHVLFVAYWLIRLNNKIYISVLTLSISYFFSVPIFQSKSVFKALAKDKSFSIMSFNSQLAYFSGGKKEEVKEQQSKIIHFLNQEHPDVLCLQEARKGLNDYLNYPYHSNYGYSQIYSKHKIVSTGNMNFEKNSSNSSCYADILINEDTIRIYNLHLESLHLGIEDYKLLKNSLDESRDQELQSHTKNLKNKIHLAATKRVNQVNEIMESILRCPYPSVLCGDFNDVAQSYVYKQLTTQHNDAFLDSGKGYGATYRQLLFPFRIDYILTPKNWAAFNFEVLEEKLSDHQAIRCDIELN